MSKEELAFYTVVVVILLAAGFGTRMLGITPRSTYEPWPLWKKAVLVLLVIAAVVTFFLAGNSK